MDRKLKTIGYVMIPRDLLLKAFDEHPEAGGDMDAFFADIDLCELCGSGGET